MPHIDKYDFIDIIKKHKPKSIELHTILRPWKSKYEYIFIFENKYRYHTYCYDCVQNLSKQIIDMGTLIIGVEK